MATLAQLEEGMVKAYNAGDMDSARKLAAVITEARKDKSLLIAGAENVEIPGTSEPKPSRTIGERAKGAGEAALSMATGATTGTVGAVAGALGGAARVVEAGKFGTKQGADQIEQSAMRGAEAGTYAPRTQAGQEYVQNVGEVMAPLGAVAPMSQMLAAGASIPAAISSAGAMIPAAAQRVRQAAAPIQRATQAVVEPVQRAATSARETIQSVRGKAGLAGDLGAAETPAELMKRERAAQMPVPFEGESGLMKGQAMTGAGKFEQRQFEMEQAKMPGGQELQQRSLNQREVLEQNFDALADVANPNTIELPDIGAAVDRALVNRANARKAQIRREFQKADEAGEMMQPVDMTPIIAALNDAERFPGTAPLVQSIRREAERFGAIAADESGELVGAKIPIRDAESIRQFVNDKRTIDWSNPKEAAIGRIIKSAIDESTEAAGGDIYRNARKMRREFAQEFENTSLTRDLLGTKRGTDDRKIALEKVYDRVIVRSSVEEMNKLRATLIKSGGDGKQAWANLKSRAMDDLKEAGLTRSIDSNDNRTFSPAALNKAIQRLDQTGKLEALYGKKQAQIVRDLGDIANDIFLAPPGSVNTSNTASALRLVLDSIATASVTGIPAPAMTAIKEATKYVRDAKTRQRIRETLRTPPNQKTGKF